MKSLVHWLTILQPNLVPPITTVAAALDYKRRLQIIEPKVDYIMSLYLHPDITPETIAEAAAAGITNVKSYPAGVTTNSSAGVVDYASFYPVFEAMEKHNLILNLHGELPPNAAKSGSCCGSSDPEDITVMNAEAAFLPTLLNLHAKFPNLRIILEHCTTAAAIEAVKSCGPSVAATITAHHLYLTIDAVVGNAYNFCKPVAKLPSDRLALLRAAVSKDPKFFFGTDSAPHPTSAKEKLGAPAAGCFTQKYAVQLVMDALEGAVEKGYIKEEECTAQVIEDFLGNFGRKFYGVEVKNKERIGLTKIGEKVRDQETSDKVTLANFRAGAETWSLTWGLN